MLLSYWQHNLILLVCLTARFLQIHHAACRAESTLSNQSNIHRTVVNTQLTQTLSPCCYRLLSAAKLENRDATFVTVKHGVKPPLSRPITPTPCCPPHLRRPVQFTVDQSNDKLTPRMHQSHDRIAFHSITVDARTTSIHWISRQSSAGLSSRPTAVAGFAAVLCDERATIPITDALAFCRHRRTHARAHIGVRADVTNHVTFPSRRDTLPSARPSASGAGQRFNALA
jgi:hypothetical protein